MARSVSWPIAAPLAVVLQLHLMLIGLISLSWNFVAMLLYPLLPRERGLRVGRAGIAYGYRAFWAIAQFTGMMKIDAGALDALAHERGLIIAANHPSLLDALMLVARLPRSACIMKAELMRNIFLGAGARLARYIRNDSTRGMIRLAVADLRAGNQLILFPEGTRTTQSPINPFRPGITLISKLAKAPIQTVFIETDSPYLSKDWPLWKLPPLPIVFSVRLGQRFEPSQNTDELLHRLEDYFRAGMRRPPSSHS
ncbi:MAG TPA: lysophospholipid acyltransferase family protein [Burkholderiaceae bacterium]|jgi:1-acyl-sn-glycerol-3-phosphate acyltransferase|nr:lysophospholipid acyltransferase family protein [Burkholderiaceae bacterium]